ncbi:MAG: DinB family protein [Chloroflexi bacterium]|nr:DinB family protein [Chloroflexota bacterium]
MITSLRDYLAYFVSVRKRTHLFIEAVPPTLADWSPAPGEYTCGDIVRHLGSVQLMNWRLAAGEPLKYPGHDPALGADLPAARTYLDACHAEGVKLLEALPDSILAEKRVGATGQSASVWRFLMATVEHEVHHRSQLANYLTWLGHQPPQLFGVNVEDLPE